MESPCLDGYLREVCQRCWLALLASMQLRDLLGLGAAHPGRLGRPDASRVWHLQCWQAVETILSSGAVLSRLLWPGEDDPGSRARGAALRCALSVDDHSPLRDPAVTHGGPAFPGAADRWLATHPDPDMDFGVAPAGATGEHAPVTARWMDPDTWVVRMFGTEIGLSGIVEEASRLQAVATEMGSVWPLAGTGGDR